MRLFPLKWMTRLPLSFFLLICVSGAASASTVLGSQILKVAGATTMGVVYAANPMKADRVFTEIGQGEDVYIGRLGAQWDVQEDILDVYDFTTNVYLQFDIARWQSVHTMEYEGAITSVAFTPVFRFLRNTKNAMIYMDTSIGIGLISKTTINDSNFGANLQFFDSLGFGVFFGEKRQWGVGYKFNHISNNGTANPNNGIDFHMMSLSYQYQ